MAIAVIQMVSGKDILANLQQAEQLLLQAANAGARLVVLPENFAVFGHADVVSIAQAETLGQGPILPWLSDICRRLQLWCVAGTLPLLADGARAGKPTAACLVINDQGERVARYDKLHLFDVDVGDAQGRYRESDVFQGGTHAVVVDTSVGTVGLSICYDLRFPELYTQLRALGADVIAVPSAFTAVTGAAHWHTLLRARAIETQTYIVAANQGGQHGAQRATYGHSMIVDPWGEVQAELEQGPACLVAECGLELTQAIRQKMPIWAHRRFAVPQLCTEQRSLDE